MVRGGEASANLVERIEKLEEELRSSAQLFGFCQGRDSISGHEEVFQRANSSVSPLKTAALVQKNSEATLALAAKEDLLEKELGEIQKMLLAMQEQQQKQLELILAIGMASKLWDNREEATREEYSIKSSKMKEGEKQMHFDNTHVSSANMGAANDRA